jgi:hypothetical protein
MDAGDALESVERRLITATQVFTSEAVRTALARGMSRTYSDSFRVLIRAITTAASAARASGSAALMAAAAAGGAVNAAVTVSALSELYGAAQRGAVSAELYASALLCAARAAATAAARAAAAEQLNAARNVAFGLPTDTAGVAAADAAILAEYHPAQAMCFTALAFVKSEPAAVGLVLPAVGSAPPPAGGASDAGDGTEALDIAFPQARLAVEYDLAPLTDRRSAQRFGPIASMTAGLSYRLVERLRTIRATERGAPAPPGPRTHGLWPAGAPLWVTTGGAGRLAAPARAAAWAPFAGARPYTLAYSEAAAVVVLAAVRAERGDWSLELAQQYGAHVREPAVVAGGACSADVLVRELVRGFELVYDVAPPTTPKEFRALAVGDEFVLDGYVVAAVARVAEEMTEARLRAELISVNAPRVPYEQLAREMRVTQALRTVDAALALWRRLRPVLHADADAFGHPSVKRRALLLAAFRRAVDGVARAQPLVCAPPSLKLFAAGRARGS